LNYAKKNCSKCRKSDIKLNWKNSQWKQKYKNCNYYFVEKYRKTPKIKSEKIFNDWLFEWYLSRQIWIQNW